MLNLKNISFSYTNKEKIYDNINISINTTQITAIAGRNGTGKTTLAKIIMGLIKPTSGAIELDNNLISDMPAYARAKYIGYVFQHPDHQLFASTVYEETAYAPTQLGFSPKEIDENVRQALVATGLTGKESKLPQTLSLGDKQRLCLASTLAAKPSILILDEPTSGQDCRERVILLRLMHRLNENGTGIILITHDMDILAEHADTVIVLSKPQVAFLGTPRELFTDSKKTAALGLELPEAAAVSQQMNLGTCLTPAELYAKLARRKEKSNA